MKKKISLVLIFIPYLLSAQNYSVLSVPDSLIKNAEAVLRFEEAKIIIASPKSAIYKHKYAITVLRESGDNYAKYYNSYDKFDKLSEAVAKLYDASGKLIKTIKKREMEDVAYEDKIHLFSDARVKHCEFYNKTYPYTIEIEEEEDFDGIFHLPYWRPVRSSNFSVQQSSLIVQTPGNYNIHYKLLKNTEAPHIVQNGNNKVYQWNVKNVLAIEYEVLQPDIVNYIPGVYITPSDFEIGGYSGNMDSWSNLGKFILSLNKGKDVLPENIKKQVHALTDNLSSTDEKIKVLYNFMQQNTHYILVTLGLGGWEPFDATYVAQNKYGDCKALSNYMVSLLKEANISAKYVLITAGDGLRGLWPDFPAPYFNHAVMCVPNGKDTTWLECTSQTESAGYMGTFTGDRDALLIDDDGGHVVHTPVYTAINNIEIRKVNATIDEEGNLLANMHTGYSGIQQEDAHIQLHYRNKEEREKYLNKHFSLPTYKIENFEYNEQQGKIPVIEESIKLSSPNYASVSGKRLFVQPNLFNKISKLPADNERKFDIQIRYSYLDIDTINIIIPIGYTVESIPKDESSINEFGEYKISYHIDKNKLQLIRIHKQGAHYFSASNYNALINFYDAMYKADRARIVFIKKE
jgi:hypothetical protein